MTFPFQPNTRIIARYDGQNFQEEQLVISGTGSVSVTENASGFIISSSASGSSGSGISAILVQSQGSPVYSGVIINFETGFTVTSGSAALVSLNFDTSTFVQTSGTQTVSGVKTFTDGVLLTYSISDANHAVTKSYVDAASGTLQSSINSNTTSISTNTTNINTLSGSVVFTSGTQTVSGLKTFADGVFLNYAITSGTHATTKTYVDAISGALQSSITSNTTNISSNTTNIATLSGSVVFTSGNQTISGVKTFVSPIITASGLEPATSGSTGTKGELRWSTDYIYVCITDNIWKRVPLAAF